MARNKRLYIIWEGIVGYVYVRATDKHVATIQKNAGSHSFRFRLASNPARHSEIIETVDKCLTRIEREVF